MENDHFVRRVTILPLVSKAAEMAYAWIWNAKGESTMLAPKTASRTEPIAVLGAGDLVSHLHRGDDADDPANYRFSVFRLSQELQATHELRPSDLRDLVKLCQVSGVRDRR